MISVGDQVSLKEDPCIEGYKVGDTGRVIDIHPQEYFFPVQVKMDHPDNDGHSYYRFNYKQLNVVKDITWLAVPTSEEMDIPL